MEYRGPATGEPFDRAKPVGFGGSDRQWVAGLDSIGPPEGHNRPGNMETEHGSDVSSGNGRKGGMRHCHVHRRMVGIGILDQRELFHNQEDK